jgi:hypothetical protein
LLVAGASWRWSAGCRRWLLPRLLAYGGQESADPVQHNWSIDYAVICGGTSKREPDPLAASIASAIAPALCVDRRGPSGFLNIYMMIHLMIDFEHYSSIYTVSCAFFFFYLIVSE